MLRLVKSCETLEDYRRLVSQGGHILNILPGGVLTAWSSNGSVAPVGVGASAASPAHLPQETSPLMVDWRLQAVGNSSGASDVEPEGR